MNEYGLPRWQGEAGPPGSAGTGAGTTGTMEYEAGEALASGQPVALSYEMLDGNEVRTTVVAIQLDTPPYLLIGTTLYSALPGEMVTVVLNGLCDVRVLGEGHTGLIHYTVVRKSLGQDGPHQEYSALYNKGRFNFQDHGGENGSYQINAQYNIHFDAGPGRTWNLEFTELEWQFEQGSSSLWDRMYVEVADSLEDFTTQNDNPLQLPWMLSTGNIGASFAGYSKNTSNTSNTARNVIPKTWAEAIQNGATSTSVSDPNQIITEPYNAIFANTGKRFVRFTLRTDNAVSLLGWEIKLRSIYGSSSTINPPYGTEYPMSGDTLYVQSTDTSRVSKEPTSYPLGYAVSNVDNEMVKMYRPIGG